MPKFMGGFGNSKSWSRTAAVPKCGPSKSEMTLMEAAAETRKANKKTAAATQRAERKALARVEATLAKAERRGDARAVKAARAEIKKRGG